MKKKNKTRQAEQLRYTILWKIGTFLSLLLYSSGMAGLCLFLRRKVFKRHRSIVLTYHSIRDDQKRPDISVPTSMFRRQMAYLRKRFNVLPLHELLKNRARRAVMSKDELAITFDDGYKDNFLNAFAILREYKLPATIFLISAQIGKNDEFLKPDEIKIMQANNVEFASHTAHHLVLAEVDSKTAEEEITSSKAELENILNDKVEFFAYPKGKKKHFNERTKALIEKAGYKAAFTTENGAINSKSDFFALNRIGIRNCPLFVFKVRLWGIFESWPFLLIRKFLKLT